MVDVGLLTGRVKTPGLDRMGSPNLTRPDSPQPMRFRVPPDPTRPDPILEFLKDLLTRPAGRVLTREQPCFLFVFFLLLPFLMSALLFFSPSQS